MDPKTDTRPQGAFSALLADQDLTHLELVVRRSLIDDAAGPVLSPAYWRDRLARVARGSHLSHTQLQTVHRLYLQIEAYEIRHPEFRRVVVEPDPGPQSSGNTATRRHAL